MKVVCVDDRFVGEREYPYLLPNGRIVKGESYTVVEHCELPNGERGYKLAEKPVVVDFPIIGAWAVRRFVPAHYYAAEFSVKETEPQTATI